MWSPSTSEDILKSLGRLCVLDRCETFISDFILPQSWFMFRETELKRVTTLAPPHPVCVRYTERSHTVSSFSETDRLGALGLGMGTPPGSGGGHLMLETKECQAKSLGSCCCYSFNMRSRGHKPLFCNLSCPVSR